MDAFDRIRETVHEAGEGRSATSLAYRPDSAANSIGWLIWHLARVQDDHIAELAGREQAYVADGWADRLGMAPDTGDIGYGHTSEQVGAVALDGPDVVLAYYDSVHDRTLEYIDTINAAELDRIVDYGRDPPVSAGVRLVSVISDCLQHAGQANYLGGLLDRMP